MSSSRSQNKAKKDEGLNDDEPSVIHLSTMCKSYLVAMAIQSQVVQAGNKNTNVNMPRLNWKANYTCHKCGNK